MLIVFSGVPLTKHLQLVVAPLCSASLDFEIITIKFFSFFYM